MKICKSYYWQKCLKKYTIVDYQFNEEVHMRKKIFHIKLILLTLVFFSQLTIPITNIAFSQTSPETAAEQWSLRQTEIEQLYQEEDLQGALNIAQEAVSLAETAFGSASLKQFQVCCCRHKFILNWINLKRLIKSTRLLLKPLCRLLEKVIVQRFQCLTVMGNF